MVKPFAEYELPDEMATTHFAQGIAPLLKRGDVVLLRGDLGAGKTSFARALLRCLAMEEIEVPSPTFTLVQVYEFAKIQVWHFDLYRLSRQDEIYELGWEDALGDGIALVEWPERLGELAPGTALTLEFGFAGQGRIVALSGDDRWKARVESKLS